MAFSDFVRYAERKINGAGIAYSQHAGWSPSIIGYWGFGDKNKVRVFARIIMRNPQPSSTQAQRGFRQFFTIEVGYHPVTIRVGNATVHTRSNASGYVDIPIRDHGLEPGWRSVTVAADGAPTVETEVLILAPTTRYALISDIDDTVMVTMLPRALIAAYNSWYLKTNTRKPVAGMADFYHSIRQSIPPDHTDLPVFYLSTGAWNTFPALVDFLHQHRLPKGPMLLTDWGPTQTSLFRSGKEHKRVQLRNLIIDFPDITWILVGDDGQHDPFIFGDIASEHPSRIAAIAIRELTPGEHVLAHGTAAPLGSVLDRGLVPTISGADGYELREQWEAMDPLRPISPDTQA